MNHKTIEPQTKTWPSKNYQKYDNRTFKLKATMKPRRAASERAENHLCWSKSSSEGEVSLFFIDPESHSGEKSEFLCLLRWFKVIWIWQVGFRWELLWFIKLFSFSELHNVFVSDWDDPADWGRRVQNAKQMLHIHFLRFDFTLLPVFWQKWTLTLYSTGWLFITSVTNELLLLIFFIIGTFLLSGISLPPYLFLTTFFYVNIYSTVTQFKIYFSVFLLLFAIVMFGCFWMKDYFGLKLWHVLQLWSMFCRCSVLES